MRSTSTRRLSFALLIAAPLPFLASTALAQSDVPAAADLPGLVASFVSACVGHGWPTAVSIGLLLLAFGTRFLTAKEASPYFHSPQWMVLSSAIVAICTAVSRSVAHGFSGSAITGAIFMGLLASGLLNNPTVSGVVSKAAAVLVFCSVALTGCSYCFQPTSAQYASKECQVARQTVDCTTAAAKGEVAPGIAIGKTLIDSGTVDVPTLESSLISLGFHDAQCILAALFADFSKAGASPGLPPHAAANRSAFVNNWRAAHGPTS